MLFYRKPTGRRKTKPVGFFIHDYAAHHVREYWIVGPRKQVIEQYILNEDLQAFALENALKIQQEIESETLSGFRISVRAVLDEEASNQALVTILNA